MELLVAFILVRLLLCRGYDNLSVGKNSVQSSMWQCPPSNPGCTMYVANNAVDGIINTCMRTDMIGLTSEDKTVWWTVDLGDIKSVYSISIQFKDYGQKFYNRSRGRLAGFSLYLSNETERQSGYLCYKDGPELPALNFTDICAVHGRYVTFYNERMGKSYPDGYVLNGVVTDLCEVIVLGCQKNGFYGHNCDFVCPLNCQKKRCNIINGTCLGCTTGWIGDFCNKTCTFGYYGLGCTTKCTGRCLYGVSCNHVSGKCENGCEAGWLQPSCDQPCHNGWYGSNCLYKCSGKCKNSLPCDKASGECESCAPGYMGKLCNTSCSKGTYGQNCTEICNSKCRNQNCFHEDGFCNEGCEDGFQGNTCTEKCKEGWYGENCSKECSFNCIMKSCHNVHGHCSHGCKQGWIGLYCSQPCRLGFYGENCTKTCSSFCRISRHCNNTDGNCIEGCKDGYVEPKCDESCSGGWYGKNCSQRCNENCINQTCDHRDGMCTFGCKPGWSTANCSEACGDGFYGKNCTKRCLNCLNDACNPFNGYCIQGCDDGFTGSICEQPCMGGWYGRNCSNRCNQNCRNKSCNNTHGGCTDGCEPGWMDSNCSKECTYGMYGANCAKRCGKCADNATCDRINGSCVHGCEKSFTGDKCHRNTMLNLRTRDSGEEATDNGVLGGTLTTCFIFLGALTIITIVVIRRRRNIKEKDIANPQGSPIALNFNVHAGHEEIKVNGNNNTVLKPQSVEKTVSPKNNTMMTVSELQTRIEFMSENANASFKTEYEKIQKGELHQCSEGKKPENRSKNRYMTTFPYDHSRVILKKSSPKESDYINANYIEDAQGRKAYIATQGPKPKTITDFWRMVWQEDISIIVCLTNLKEGIKTKCALYWPNTNDKIQSGDICVRHQDEKVYANHTVRKLRIQYISDNSERDVFMFHYTQWPDHGVPEPLSLVVFHRHVMMLSGVCQGKYTLVHCSAGIGRTGTYIALDALYRQAVETGEIDVQNYLEIMRKDRMNMIQGEDQYKTVYLALFESFRGKPRSISTERFSEEFQEQSCYMNLGDVANKSPLSAEFEELMSIKKEYSEKDYEFGRNNKEANLTPNVLPVEEYMCQVFNSKGVRRYYNAVLLQSFTRSDCLISAQYPLPDYVEDFLRIVRAFYTPIIVSLFPLREFPSSSFWLPTKNENKTVGEFTTKFSESTKMANIVKTNIVLHSKESSDVRVTILESTTWKGENNTTSRRVLIDLIKEAKMEENIHPGARILILSSDGAKRCGQFCVVYNALEQMTMEKEVDIFTITRLLQIRRPEFINNLEDYQFCYDTVADYLQNDTVYANC